jgi:hypothetical protein
VAKRRRNVNDGSPLSKRGGLNNIPWHLAVNGTTREDRTECSCAGWLAVMFDCGVETTKRAVNGEVAREEGRSELWVLADFIIRLDASDQLVKRM